MTNSAEKLLPISVAIVATIMVLAPAFHRKCQAQRSRPLPGSSRTPSAPAPPGNSVSLPPASPPPLKFQGRYYPSPFTVGIADFLNPSEPSSSRTGFPSVLGTSSNLNGLLSAFSSDWMQVPADIGLDGLFGSRLHRQTLVADFNGDGILDVLANTYSKANDPNSRLELYLGRGDGTFVRDDSNDALFSHITGHGETMVVADFNNDGALDVFLPYYTKPGDDTQHPNATHMSLLLNDGTGHFIDATVIDEVDDAGSHHSVDEAGVGCVFDPASPYASVTVDGLTTQTPNRYLYWQPEGAQAVDFNQDGRIDLYVASRLFINQGNRSVVTGGRTWQVPVFVDRAAAYGLVDLDRHNLGTNQLFHTNTAAFNQWANNHSYGSAAGPVSYLNAFGPMFFDEGAKFLDWNNDGSLDLVLEDAGWGPALFEFNAATQKFTWRQWTFLADHRVPFFNSGPPNYGEILPRVDGNLIPAPGNEGINAYDLDNTGFEDILVGGAVATDQYSNWVFRNRGYGFEWMQSSQTAPTYGSGPVQLFGPVNEPGGPGAMALGDINGDGLIDIIYPLGTGVMCYINRTQTSNRSFVIEVVGPNGEKNQQGRVVTIANYGARNAIGLDPNPVYTRVVDSGSGYMAQNQYDILFALPYLDLGLGSPQAYRVSVAFPNVHFTTGFYPGILPADNRNGLRIYAPSPKYPGGRSETFRLHAPAAAPDPPTDTVGIFRPAEYNFYLNSENAPQIADLITGIVPPPGLPDVGTPSNGVFPLAGDWTGSGSTSIGLFDAPHNTFYLRNSDTTGGADIVTVFKPELDDVPLAGDWTGRGVETVGVYRKREHTFYLRSSNDAGEADLIVTPTVPDDSGSLQPPEDDDIPIVGDWSGNRTTKIGLYRPRTQMFYLFNSNTSNSRSVTTWIADPNAAHGGADNQLLLAFDAHPVTGDWTGDGKVKIGLYATDTAPPYARTFYFGSPADGVSGMPAQKVAVTFAEDGDVPIVGDWDNSGRSSYGVYRPGGSLFILQTGAGIASFRYGEITDNDGVSFLDIPFVAPLLNGPPFVNIPVVGKWTQGHGATVGVYQTRDRVFALRNTNDTGNGDVSFSFSPNAPTSDVPIVGDWLGQGNSAIGIYRASNKTFYLANSTIHSNADIQMSIMDLSALPGKLDGMPVAGDWDGNGSTTTGLYDPSAQAFYLRNSNTTGPYDIKVDVSAFALPGDIPVAGSWSSSMTGNTSTSGMSTLGLYRPSTSHWLLFYEPMTPGTSETGKVFVPTQVYEFRYGNPYDIPVTGHWTVRH